MHHPSHKSPRHRRAIQGEGFDQHTTSPASPGTQARSLPVSASLPSPLPPVWLYSLLAQEGSRAAKSNAETGHSASQLGQPQNKFRENWQSVFPTKAGALAFRFTEQEAEPTFQIMCKSTALCIFTPPSGSYAGKRPSPWCQHDRLATTADAQSPTPLSCLPELWAAAGRLYDLQALFWDWQDS